MTKINETSAQNVFIQHIKHTRGDTFKRTYVFYDKNGQPLDTTGYRFSMQIRRHPNAEVLDVDIPSGSFLLSDENGTNDKVTVTHTAEDFIDLVGTYTYDIQFEVAGETFTFVAGQFRIKLDVTRPISEPGGVFAT